MTNIDERINGEIYSLWDYGSGNNKAEEEAGRGHVERLNLKHLFSSRGSKLCYNINITLNCLCKSDLKQSNW